jgi:hypothetical protein
MTEEELLEKLKEFKFWTGKSELTIEDIAMLQPGLARIMPEVGQRTWKLYYAAKAGNWPLAKFQYKEVRGLFEMGAITRPKHAEALNEFMEQGWKEVGDAVDRKDFEAFEAAFHRSIEAANAYHELKEKPYLIWKLPDAPPPDLQMEPRGVKK